MTGRRDRGSTPGAALLAAVGLTVALVGCGGGDGCSGFITVNASPERCAELAEELGCDGFEAGEGPACGLFACARCEDEG